MAVFAFLVFVLLTDIYTYKGIKSLFDGPRNVSLRMFLRILFWLVPSLLLSSVFYASYLRPVEPDPKIFNGYFYIVAFALMFYLPKLVFISFHLIDDIIYVIEKVVKRVEGIFRYRSRIMNMNISQLKIFSRTGLVLSVIPFLAIIYGMAIGRFDFQVTTQTIEFENLPESFDGFRIVHISDLHIGSFHGYEDKVKRAVQIINDQNPDLIVFTGDLVNNFTAELNGFTEILTELGAPYGVYSILGNHDYGDYFQWESPKAKSDNMQEMIALQEKMGWRLLINEWHPLVAGHDTIVLAGVENWGKPPFPVYGDLVMALDGTERYPFIILLSHDPSHWDAEVLGQSNVHLTLSGHTHGMQVGIETAMLRWSPSKMKYPRWGGLYREGDRYLYVNRGLGYVAFPGRIGMPPEITVIEIKSY